MLLLQIEIKFFGMFSKMMLKVRNESEEIQNFVKFSKNYISCILYTFLFEFQELDFSY